MSKKPDSSTLFSSKFINRMDKDAQLLANRIALLKQEELKTRKKIEETKKKSKEIIDKKVKLEERQSKVRIC